MDGEGGNDGEAVDVGNIREPQYLKCERLEIMSQNEMLCFGLLATDVRITHSRRPATRHLARASAERMSREDIDSILARAEDVRLISVGSRPTA